MAEDRNGKGDQQAVLAVEHPCGGIYGLEACAKELRRCFLGGALFQLSHVTKARRICFLLALSWEGGAFYSLTARRILQARYGVRIGAYSYGGCFEPGAFPGGVAIGRYVSIAAGVRVFLRNHPSERLSLHPFFYNMALGMVAEDTISTGALRIEHDAWIGERAIITPGCPRIGLGAVVGAGAVVTKEVADFAVVAGNPARLIRMRFPEEVCDRIRTSQWWLRSIKELSLHLDDLTRPLGEGAWLAGL